MSEAFDSFLKQYHALGREKLDGYDSSHFEGLTPQEFATAEQMLIEDAMKLDTSAIQGLGYVRSEKTEKTLRSLLTKVKAPCDLHLCLAKALWKITNDQALQETILEDFSKDNDNLRQQAAIALQYTLPSQIMFDTFVEMLKSEQKSVMRTLAASGLLLFYGLLDSYTDMVNFQKHLTLVRKLTHSTDESSLTAAIAEVEKEAAKLNR
jgi:hypothetical protein